MMSVVARYSRHVAGGRFVPGSRGSPRRARLNPARCPAYRCPSVYAPGRLQLDQRSTIRGVHRGWVHDPPERALEGQPRVPEDQWRGLRALLADPTWRTTDKYTRTYLGSGLYLCAVSWARHRALRPPPAGQSIAARTSPGAAPCISTTG